MGEHNNAARGENEWAATYGNMGMAAPVQLMQLPLHILDPWTDITGEAQPFQPYTPAMLKDLADNIRRNGIIQPLNVRPRPNGRFQIIAGHNRVTGAKMAGLSTVPALVQELDDDQAAILMIDSNLKTRPHILPSERARAYKLRMEKLSHQGKRTDLTCGPMVHKLDIDPTYSACGPMVHKLNIDPTHSACGPLVHKSRSRDLISEETGINARQIQRFLRLNDLHPDLLKMVDNGYLDKEQQDKNIPAMALRAGVELSYIPVGQQALLLVVMREYGCKAPSMAQAGHLRSMAATQPLDEETIRQILQPGDREKKEVLKLPSDRLKNFFPPDTSVQEMENTIFEALTAYLKEN